jgi:hypothetical protein
MFLCGLDEVFGKDRPRNWENFPQVDNTPLTSEHYDDHSEEE